jgi:hypothetical protein
LHKPESFSWVDLVGLAVERREHVRLVGLNVLQREHGAVVELSTEVAADSPGLDSLDLSAHPAQELERRLDLILGGIRLNGDPN